MCTQTHRLICPHTCLRAHTLMHAQTLVYTHTQAHACMHTHACIHTHALMCTHTGTRTHVCTHSHTHLMCMCTHTHISSASGVFAPGPLTASLSLVRQGSPWLCPSSTHQSWFQALVWGQMPPPHCPLGPRNPELGFALSAQLPRVLLQEVTCGLTDSARHPRTSSARSCHMPPRCPPGGVPQTQRLTCSDQPWPGSRVGTQGDFFLGAWLHSQGVLNSKVALRGQDSSSPPTESLHQDLVTRETGQKPQV